MTDPQIPIGAAVAGSTGELLGHVAAIYTDNATGRPAWASVQTGGPAAVVPLALSRFDGAVLHVPYGAQRLRSAPLHDPATLITYPQGDDLARHYGLIPPTPDPHPSTRTAEQRVPGAAEDRVMVRSEERLRTGTVNVVVGRARLVTYLVTEDQTFTVPVTRQEFRLVIDPVPPGEQVISDVAPAEEIHEVVRYAEQVLISTQNVPVERVRMVRRVVTGGQTVTAQIRSEQIDHTTAHRDIGQRDGGQSDADPRVAQPVVGEQPWD